MHRKKIIIINWRPINTFIDLCMFDMALELNGVLTLFSATMSPISSASIWCAKVRIKHCEKKSVKERG